MITVNNLSKVIDKKEVLHDINISFDKSKIYGIVGENGCGKTMLLRVICGLITPTIGKIIKDEKITFGAIIETPGFMFDQSGLYNLKYLASLNNCIKTTTIISYLKEFGLYEVRNKAVKKYSLGMQQKLGIIQAIMESPDVIVLDEPFNALDDKSFTNKGMKKLCLNCKIEIIEFEWQILIDLSNL